MTADPRVTAAREYLASARERKLAELPPSVLLRQAAELRRLLGQVLDAIDQADEWADLTGQPADPEPYCETCGEWVGHFLGLTGWHHYRGDPDVPPGRELYDAGHEVVIGWIAP